MVDAARNDGRDLDLLMSYSEKLRKHGFINVTEKTVRLPLDSIHPKEMLHETIIRNWSEGFEAWSLELMARLPYHDDSTVQALCRRARATLEEGTHGYLEW